jgi:hypothetical protein|tara:strand:- start:273 stop:629 length:357 start_codon:yes stop_codon:yes gene_type:complete
MRASEFIYESKNRLRKTAQHAIPAAHTWATDFYGAYRFGLALAGSPDGPDMPEVGPTAGRMTTVAYSDGDQAILDKAAKRMGIKKKEKLTKGNKSQEMPDVNTKSPFTPKGPVKRKNK